MWGPWAATHSYLIKLPAWPPFISAMDGDDEDDSSGREKGMSVQEPSSSSFPTSGSEHQLEREALVFGGR